MEFHGVFMVIWWEFMVIFHGISMGFDGESELIGLSNMARKSPCFSNRCGRSWLHIWCWKHSIWLWSVMVAPTPDNYCRGRNWVDKAVKWCKMAKFHPMWLYNMAITSLLRVGANLFLVVIMGFYRTCKRQPLWPVWRKTCSKWWW